MDSPSRSEAEALSVQTDVLLLWAEPAGQHRRGPPLSSAELAGHCMPGAQKRRKMPIKLQRK